MFKYQISQEGFLNKVFGYKENDLDTIRSMNVSVTSIINKLNKLSDDQINSLIELPVNRFYRYTSTCTKIVKDGFDKKWNAFLKYFAPVIDKALNLTIDGIKKESDNYQQVKDLIKDVYDPVHHNKPIDNVMDSITCPGVIKAASCNYKMLGYEDRNAFNIFFKNYLEAAAYEGYRQEWWNKRKPKADVLKSYLPWEIKSMAFYIKFSTYVYMQNIRQIFIPDLSLNIDRIKN